VSRETQYRENCSAAKGQGITHNISPGNCNLKSIRVLNYTYLTTYLFFTHLFPYQLDFITSDIIFLCRTALAKAKTEALCKEFKVENILQIDLDQIKVEKETMENDDDISQGFKRGLEADKILGSADDNGELMYLIQWCVICPSIIRNAHSEVQKKIRANANHLKTISVD